MKPEAPLPPDAAPWLVAAERDLRALARRLAGAAVVAMDVEANSLHAYRERVCVLQVTADGASAIVDAVAIADLSPLLAVTDRDDVEVVFHGGDYDIAMLRRDHGFRFRRVFDTMIAATVLGEPRIGLADLVRDAYGVELDKRFQTADWARRPLTPEQIAYLHRDTAYLPGLRDRLCTRLEEADLLEEAEIEFDRLARREAKPRLVDPEGWRRIKGARGLDAAGRAILHALHAWREGEAERIDRPPFKVLAPAQMVALARDPPKRLDRTEVLAPLPAALRRRHGKALLRVLRQGREAVARGEVPDARSGPRPKHGERARREQDRRLEDRLRTWRREEARSRGVPNLVVLPNRALAWLVRTRPRAVAELSACADIGPKRVERYGTRILDLLRGSKGD